MKDWLRHSILYVLLMTLVSGTAWAETRIATVDFKKVYENYWKKQQSEKIINEMREDARKEHNNQINEIKKVNEEYQTIQSNATDPAISQDEREKRKKTAEDKLRQLRDMDKILREYDANAEARIRDQVERTLSRMVEEIRTVITAKAKSAGFSLVIDVAAVSGVGTPVVFYTNNENDMTEGVITALNVNARSDTAKADEKPASKPDEKKKDADK